MQEQIKKLKDEIKELMEKLNALPLTIRTALTDAILAEALTVSPVMLINKLDMLAVEMPDMVESELQDALM